VGIIDISGRIKSGYSKTGLLVKYRQGVPLVNKKEEVNVDLIKIEQKRRRGSNEKYKRGNNEILVGNKVNDLA